MFEIKEKYDFFFIWRTFILTGLFTYLFFSKSPVWRHLIDDQPELELESESEGEEEDDEEESSEGESGSGSESGSESDQD